MIKHNKDGTETHVKFVVSLRVDDQIPVDVRSYDREHLALRECNRLNGFKGFFASVREVPWPE